MFSSRARERKVLSNPKNTSALGVLPESDSRIRRLSVAPVSPPLTKLTLMLLVVSKAYMTSWLTEKESCVKTVRGVASPGTAVGEMVEVQAARSSKRIRLNRSIFLDIILSS